MITDRRRLVVAAAAALALSPVLAACGSPSAPAPSGGGAEPINVAFLAYTASDFTNAYIRGVDEVVTPGGGSTTLFSSEFDPQKQASQCEDAITSGRYNAIILVPVDPVSSVACVAQAAAAGIPVATAETAIGENPYSLEPQVDGIVAVATSVLASQVESDAELIRAACGEKSPCKVVAEVSSPTDRWTNDVVGGVTTAVAPDAEIVATFSTMYDPAEVTKALPDILTAHPDLAVFFALSDQSAMAAVPLLESRGLTGQVKLIGLGASAEGIDAVESGVLFGTTGNWPVQTGAALATALTQAVRGETVTQPSIDMSRIDSPSVITIENASQFAPEWGSGS